MRFFFLLGNIQCFMIFFCLGTILLCSTRVNGYMLHASYLSPIPLQIIFPLALFPFPIISDSIKILLFLCNLSQTQLAYSLSFFVFFSWLIRTVRLEHMRRSWTLIESQAIWVSLCLFFTILVLFFCVYGGGYMKKSEEQTLRT